MSGHSKWSTIKRQKAVTDARRSAVFTKHAKLIAVAARIGGADTDTNFRLRLAIQKAREVNMPNDNIERAIQKGAGGSTENQLESVMYEGYGPHGSALIIEWVTDNKNRTTGELRNILSKAGGSLASSNSVAWQFTQKGVIRISASSLEGRNADELQLALVDSGADDVIEEAEGWTVLCARDQFAQMLAAVMKLGLPIASQGLEYIPNATVNPVDRAALEKLIETLEEHDDIENVYTNAKL